MQVQLEALAKKFGTDKATLGYMPLYEEYFTRQGFTRENVKNVLEIGVQYGSSLRLWAEFFPNAQVHGLDIALGNVNRGIVDHPNIHTHAVDQSSTMALDRFTMNAVKDRQFDLIVDDGSHDQQDQQVTLAMLFGCLRPGGLFVIEDLVMGLRGYFAFNRLKVTPTREVLQTLQATGKLPEEFLNGQFIESAHQYCEYRESGVAHFQDVRGETHFNQIAFIGRKA